MSVCVSVSFLTYFFSQTANLRHILGNGNMGTANMEVRDSTGNFFRGHV